MGAAKTKIKGRINPAQRPLVRRSMRPVNIRTTQSKRSTNLLQPSLKVGAVNDPAEREAEIMASRVVASSTPSLAAAPVAGSGAESANITPLRRAAEAQPNLDELQQPEIPADQKDFDVPAAENVSTGDLGKTDTDEMDSGTPVDTSGEPPAPESPPIEDAPPPVMPDRSSGADAVVGRSGGAAPLDVANLVAHPGPGRPLPRGLRQRLEPHFGTSFKQVRLHDSAVDQRAAGRIGARAFTHKNHIWLGQGESHTNTRLMAHELTHVVQQTKGSNALPINREPVIRRGYFANKAESYARHVPGYSLITVLLGRTLVSGKKVQMTAENLLGGFMGLLPGGTLIFDRLKEARVIQEAFSWVKGKLGELNLTWSRIEVDLAKALDTYNPYTASKNIKKMLVNLVRDVARFVKSIANQVLEFIIRGALKLAGPYADKVWGVIKQARDTIGLILKNPIAFAKNLVGGIVGGFKQFGRNIFTHLKNGLLGWIFGSLEGAGITLPAKLDFKGLISLVLQILGITYDNFRKQLVKKLGPNGEKKVTMVEKSVTIVKVLLKEGFAGIWEKMLGMIDNFKKTLIGGMTSMVIKTIVEVGLSWLAGLSNPVGAVVKVVFSIYKLIVAFIERLQQIKEVAASIFQSIGAIAKGQVKKAADFVEKTIGRTIPVVLGFLAALLGLDGIPRRIRGIIKTLQKPVKKAMGKLIGFVVKKTKKLFSKLIKKLNSKRKLPSRNFKIGKTQHRIFVEKKGKKKVITKIASSHPAEPDKVLQFNKEQLQIIKDKEAKIIATKIDAMLKDADKETNEAERKIDPSSENKNQVTHMKMLDDELAEAAKELEESSRNIDSQPEMSSDTEHGLYRAAEPRSEKFEGNYGHYGTLQSSAKTTNFSASIDEPLSRYYEIDHTIEKRFPKAIIENLHLLREEKTVKGATSSVVRADTREKRNRDKEGVGKATSVRQKTGTEAGENFGLIGGEKYEKIANTATQFPSIAVYHRNHVKEKGKGLADHTSVIQMARKNGEGSAHDRLKKSIKKQLDAELDEMKKKLANDKSASDIIKSNMDAGLAAAKAENERIYKLSGITPRADTKKEANAKFDAAIGTSVFPFDKSEGTTVSFLKEEGLGQNYGKFNSGKGHFFENDHIIDKAFPKRAAGLKLLNDEQKNKIEELAKNGAPLTSEQKGRLNMLADAPMFAPKSNIAKFSDYKGFAIAIYRPLAKRVTSASDQQGKPDQVEKYGGQVGAGANAKLAEYVKDGSQSARTEGIGVFHNYFKKKFIEKSDHHSNVVAREYRIELVKVPAINSEANKNKAKTNMVEIISRVSTSLKEARTRTEQLFN